MKQDLFTLTMASILTMGLSSCGGETKTTTSQTESIQSADQAVDRVDTQTTKDKYWQHKHGGSALTNLYAFSTSC